MKRRSRAGRPLTWLLIGALASLPIAHGQDAVRSPDATSSLPESLRLANGLMRERKFDLAAEEYQRFLESGPTGPASDDARFGLANARLFQGRYKESRTSFREFLDKAPQHPRARTARYRLGELAYMLGDLPGARQALESFVKGPRHPNLETAWTYLGDVYLGLEDLPAARSAYERSLEDFPRGQLADRSRFGLGKTLARLGELDGAATLFSALVREGAPDWIERARLQLGKVQLAGGHLEAALKSFEALDRAADRGTPLKAEAGLGRAEVLARLKRPDEAAALLSTLVDEGAETVAPRASLALATLELGRSRPDIARKLLEDAIARFPRSPLLPAFRFRWAEALQKQARLGEARAAFLKLVETHPDDPWADDALARAAGLALEAGDHAETRRLAASFVQRFPKSPLMAEVRFMEARGLIAGGEPREAVPILEGLVGAGKAQDASRGGLSGSALAVGRYELAHAYRATGQVDKADALLAGLAGEAKSPVGGEARFLVAQRLVEQGRFAEAIEPMTQYLASGPKPGVEEYAMAHLATAQLGVGRFDEAGMTVAALAKKFPASPALHPTRLRLAEAALDRGRPEPAAEQFRLILTPATAARAPRVDPAPPAIRARAQVGLGRALWKLGKPAEAATAFEAYLAGSQSEPQAPAVALERAGALEAAGQDPAALAAYRELSDRHARSPEAVLAALARARLLARTGASDEAAKVFGELLSAPEKLKALSASGESAAGLMAERGWALADAGKTTDADVVFGSLLTSFPESPQAAEARFHLAESANQAGNHKEVVRLLDPLASPRALDARALQGPPRAAVSRIVPLTVYRLGRSQFALRDWEGAAATLDRLVRDFPGHPRAREAIYLRAEAALQRGQTEAAESLYARLEAGPASSADPPGFSELVRARHVQSLLGLKRWKEALERSDALCQQLPAGDPAIAELDFARGRALLGLARPDEARQAFQAVIKARKGGDLAAQAHLLQGETLFHQERFGEALREFWNVDILYDAPHWQAAALLEAGKVYERLGQWADAAETYDRLRTKFPSDSHAAEAEARLAAARKQAKAAGRSTGKVF